MKKNLVIVGGGFAGIAAYQSIPQSVRKHYTITLVDQHNYFLFTPLLHEVATGSLEAQHVVEAYEQILNKQDLYIQATVTDIDCENQRIHFEEKGPMDYDILVLGLGSTTNFFNIPGAQEYSYVLKNLDDAKAIRRRFIELFKKASTIDSKEDREQLLSVAIVGGGPTGVEIAAETADLFFNTFKTYYEGTIDINEASITLVNASPSLLGPYSAASQYYAQKTLVEKGIVVRNNTRVQEVHKGSLEIGDEEYIEASTIIWAGGVAIEHFSEHPLLKRMNNRIVVNEHLQVDTFDNIFVLGDMSFVEGTGKRGLPMLAQVAQQQGNLTGKNIARYIDGEELIPFTFKQKGILASLGRFKAIAEFNGINIYGGLAWFIWRTVYLINFNSWSKRLKIMVDWTVNLFSKRDISDV
jgi:NADH dehydrogenase